MQVDIFSLSQNIVIAVLGVATAVQTWREKKAKKGRQRAEASQRVAEDQTKLLAGKEQIIAMGEQQHEMLKSQVAMMSDQVEDWRKRYSTEHEEFAAYRAGRHNSDNEMQAKLLRYSADLADLRAKTDLTPVVEAQKEQTKINGRILDGLVQVVTTTNLLNQRLESFSTHMPCAGAVPIKVFTKEES